MAEYIKQEMSDLDGTGEKRVFYRMKIERNVDMEHFVERITYPGSGLSKGSVMQVMTTVAEHLARCMAEGQSVTLDGIGTFAPRLGVVKDKEIDSLDGDEPKRNARSIEVNGINFRADKELILETKLRCDLKRGGISRVRKSPFTEEERRTRALNYLNEHPFLRIQDYMAITGLKRSSANRELIRLSGDPASGITISGYGSHRVYVRRKTEGDR
ncbi:HU family DNA-binding protein [Parabacteroides sp.]